MSRQPSREKEEFWRLVLQEFEKFDGTARAFCRREGLAVNSFYSWRKKIAERDAERNGESSANFVPVKIVEPVEIPHTDNRSIEIVTPGGFTLRCADSIRTEQLGELLEVMTRIDGRAVSC